MVSILSKEDGLRLFKEVISHGTWQAESNIENYLTTGTVPDNILVRNQALNSYFQFLISKLFIPHFNSLRINHFNNSRKYSKHLYKVYRKVYPKRVGLDSKCELAFIDLQFNRIPVEVFCPITTRYPCDLACHMCEWIGCSSLSRYELQDWREGWNVVWRQMTRERTIAWVVQ